MVSVTSGHAEVVQIAYDPAKTSYEDLLDIFWKAHDPTTLNRQGADVGTQYRSIILYHDEAQKAAALGSLKKAQAGFKDRILTELAPLGVFWKAEDNQFPVAFARDSSHRRLGVRGEKGGALGEEHRECRRNDIVHRVPAVLSLQWVGEPLDTVAENGEECMEDVSSLHALPKEACREVGLVSRARRLCGILLGFARCAYPRLNMELLEARNFF